METKVNKCETLENKDLRPNDKCVKRVRSHLELQIEDVTAKESKVVLPSVPILYTYAHILSDTSQL